MGVTGKGLQAAGLQVAGWSPGELEGGVSNLSGIQLSPLGFPSSKPLGLHTKHSKKSNVDFWLPHAL